MKLNTLLLAAFTASLSSAQMVAPIYFHSPDSFQSGGTLDSLLSSDDHYLTFVPDISRDNEVAEVTVEFEARAPGNDFAWMGIGFEAAIDLQRAQMDPEFRETLEVWNYNRAAWDLISDRSIFYNQPDSAAIMQFGIPTHIQPITGQIRARLCWSGYNYMDRVRIDQFGWQFGN